MAAFKYYNFAANLPDAFSKGEDSNNYKLLAVEKYVYDAIMAVINGVYDITDIDQATGAALDMHGDIHQIKRGKSNDTQYRIRIKGKIAQSLCDGSRDSVAEALAYILSSDTSKVKIATGEETGTVDVIEIPLELLFIANFTTDEINNIVNDLLPEGVRLGDIEYSGTFEFSVADNEYDADKGFADEGGSIGGFFGLLDNVSVGG